MRFQRNGRVKQQVKKYMAIAVLTCLIFSQILAPSWGQFPDIKGIKNNVTNFTSDIEIAQGTVHLDGRELFTITAPTVSEDHQTPPITRRVQKIEERLITVVNNNFNPNDLRASYTIKNNLPVIYVDWIGRETPYEIMTVTSLDAEIDGVTPQIRATELLPILEQALKQAKQERQASYLRKQGMIAFGILFLMIGLSIIISRLQNNLKNRWKILYQKNLSASLTSPETNPLPKEQNPQPAQGLLSYNKQKDLNTFIRQSLQVLELVIWESGIFFIVGLFPQTRSLQLGINAFNQLFLLSVGFYGLNRISNLLIDRFFAALEDSSFLIVESDRSRREAIRAYTLARALKNIGSVIWFSIWIISSVAILKVDLASVIAAGGLISLALSVIFNDFIKDIITGVFILLDDQFAVGDYIAVGNFSGTVENMNLRITQIRSTKGNLITLPNRTITSVENFSNGWSQVDLSVEVSNETDVDHAIEIINQVAQELSQDPAWSAYILESPRVLGIDNINHVGITVRIFIKTKPLQQWNIAREYRRRLKLAFDQSGITIGIPHQTIKIINTSDLKTEDLINGNLDKNSSLESKRLDS